MSERLGVLLPSDVFPPRCGGAGWSAHTLARALIERNHAVAAIVPRRITTLDRSATPPKTQAHSEDVLGVPTIRVDYWAPKTAFVQNYFRYEHFWPHLAQAIVDAAAQLSDNPASINALVIHAQHVQCAPAAIMAGRKLGAPVIITVRDHWPWDYFNTGLHANRLPYPRQTWASLATDLVGRLGALRGALALPAIPYMLAHVRRRQQALRRADAVIAVSDYMAQRLAPIVAPGRLHVIPNMVDLAAIDAAIATPQTNLPFTTPYVMFVGKLERNKGAHLLIDIFRSLIDERRKTKDERRMVDEQVDSSFVLRPSSLMPELVIAGHGPLRAEIERELTALNVPVRCLDWIDHDEALRLMANCELLLFPSAWGEPLSRVPLEAGACGAAVLAMPTGGTTDIIADGVSGALEATTTGFARRLAALLDDPPQRHQLGAQARRHVEQHFAKDVVMPRVEQLYHAITRPGA
jgi:glycosyltransferase involved in cell wall biosynthesis